MDRDVGWELEMERQFDERDELRKRVKENAELYHRDIQYALDLMADLQRGIESNISVRRKLADAYYQGRKELRDAEV